MNRRRTDKYPFRLITLGGVLILVLTLFAALLGYRAIRISALALDTLDTYNNIMQEVLSRRHKKSLIPEDY